MNEPNPFHQKETEYHGDYQAFSDPPISPDNPRINKDPRKGQPGDLRQPPDSKKDDGDKPKD